MPGAHQGHIKLSLFWLGGGRKEEEAPCPQDFCSFCVCCVHLSLYCTFTADTFSCRGRIYYSTSSSLCLCWLLGEIWSF